MTGTEPPPRGQDPQKPRDAALVTPIIGAAVLLPPIATVFEIGGTVFGVPFVVVHVFGVWAALILAAFLLSRKLVHEQPAPDAPLGERRG